MPVITLQGQSFVSCVLNKEDIISKNNNSVNNESIYYFFTVSPCISIHYLYFFEQMHLP
jgi:hypothetical protein